MKSVGKQSVEIWGGIECTINRVGAEYYNQLEYSGHWSRKADIDLFASLGIKKMRYPILWEQHQPVEHSLINWEMVESKLVAMRSRGIEVIAGLVHHGSGPAFVEITEDSFAAGLADYALKVATKFPWINYYTPVNEPLTTARFCGLYGLWYPHEKNDKSFCRILINECKATVLAMKAVRLINPAAKLVQTDDLAKVYSTPALAYQATFENERRWLSYDLLCGRVNKDHALWEFLTSNGIQAEELAYFFENPCPPDIMGFNYYLTSERYLDDDKGNYPAHTHGGNGVHTYADVEAVRVDKPCFTGIKELLREAWERYYIPFAVTEVHLHCTRDEQMRWLNEICVDANSLKDEGLPMIAITPWAMLGSHGWDQLLTKPGGTYEAGVFDLSDKYPRPTIMAAMIRAYSRGKEFNHPVLSCPGWWHRNCRIIYGEVNESLSIQPAGGRALIISGRRTMELAKVCTARHLNFKIKEERVYNDIWAMIVVDEWMEITIAGSPVFVIHLGLGLDTERYMHAALDLFLDGESGHWMVNPNGKLCKQILDIMPLQHFLAS